MVNVARPLVLVILSLLSVGALSGCIDAATNLAEHTAETIASNCSAQNDTKSGTVTFEREEGFTIHGPGVMNIVATLAPTLGAAYARIDLVDPDGQNMWTMELTPGSGSTQSTGSFVNPPVGDYELRMMAFPAAEVEFVYTIASCG